MVIHDGYDNLGLVNPIVTVGVFDGVHIGHRALLGHVTLAAVKSGGESAVITFNPHPRLVLSEQNEGLTCLSTLEEKKKLIAETGISHLIVLRFTKELSEMEADVFIRDILVKEIGVKHLIVGYDNHFGKGRGGDFSKIRECSGIHDIVVEQAEMVSAPGGMVSSSSIREALLNGMLTDANRWLGYDYSLTGTVIEGRKLGRSFGFPTANIKPDDNHKLIPADGVYAVEVISGNEKLRGMLSIGFNPTVTRGRKVRSIEVHIFDFDGDLYNQTVTVIFRFRLRDEKRFDNVKQLAEQMKTDQQDAMSLLA